MDAAPPSQTPLDDLLRIAPDLAADEGVLADLTSIVQIPHLTAFVPLFQCLQRIAGAAPWIATECAIRWFDRGLLPRLQQTTAEAFARWAVVAYYRERSELHRKTTKYPIFATLIDGGTPVPSGREQLRALLILCACRWNHAPH